MNKYPIWGEVEGKNTSSFCFLKITQKVNTT